MALLVVVAWGLLAARPAAAQVDVQVQDVSGTVGTSLVLPIEVDGLDGRDVTAYEFSIPFDSSIVDVTGVSTRGTLTPTTPTVNVKADTITVAFSAAEPLGGDGVLLEVDARLVGAGRAVLGLQALQLFDRDGNEVAATTDAGIVTDAPLVDVQVPDVAGRAGDDVTLSLPVDSLDGRGITAYEFALPYDSSVVDVTGVDVSGTVTPSTPTVNIEDGELRVAVSASSPLGGSGPLLTLRGTLTGVGTDRLDFRSLKFFDQNGREVASGSRAGLVESGPRITGGLPDTTGQAGQGGLLPIRVDGLDGADVTAYEFTVPYDSSVVDVTGVDVSGTITPTAPTVNVTGEEIRVSFSGAQPLSGSGPLLRLQAQYTGTGSDVLDFSRAQFFDSDAERVASSLSAGIVTVEGATNEIQVRVADVEGDAGQAVTIPIRTDTLTGKGVSAYQFTLPFDPSVLDVTGVGVGGTLTPSLPVTNVGDDTVKVSFSAAQPLSGAGPLLNLQARLVGGGEDVLDFSNVQFFDETAGAVPSSAAPGRVTARAPSATSRATVRGDGAVSFPGTGASITFSNTSGAGEVTVRAFSDAPTDTTGIRERSVSRSRYVISAGGDLSVGAGTEARFDVTAVDSLSNPEAATVYRRDSVGGGSFTPLPTRLDTAAGELVASLSSFSEFAVASDATPPAPPSGVTAAATEERVRISWDASAAADLAAYRVYRDTTAIDSAAGPAGRPPLDSTLAGTTSLVDSSVATGTTYHYRVTAVDTAANESDFSAEVRGTPPVPLRIADLEPERGAPGTSVRIYGTGFRSTSGPNTVTFGGATAPVDSTRGTVIYARVPSGSGGPVEVSVAGGQKTATATDPFSVLTGGNEVFVASGAGLTDVRGTSAAADVDGDGDLDYAIVGSTPNGPVAIIYRNDGGTFAPLGAGLTGVQSGGDVNWGDYDGDGDPDLVVTGADGNGNPTATIYENEGGTFTALGAGLTGVKNSAAAWGDYDGDGDLDLFVHGDGGNLSPTATLYRNEDGAFVPVGTGITGRVSGPAADWGDYDGDGRPDLAVNGNSGGTEPVTLYRNTGGGTFASVQPGITGTSANGSVRWGDYNGDGRLDLVVTGDTNGPSSGGQFAAIYRNDGGGAFSRATAGLTGSLGGTGVWGDYNADGRPDLVVSGDTLDQGDTNQDPIDRATTVYTNGGAGAFARAETGLAGLGGKATWADIDADGDLDLLVTGATTSGAPITTLYENTADVRAPAPPAGLSAAAGSSRVALNWNAGGEDDLARYRIYRGTIPIDSTAGPSGRTPIDSVGGRTTTFIDSSGQVGQRYFYRVTAVDTAANESGFSGEATGRPLDKTPPDAPEGVAAAPAPDSVSLGWTGSSAADAVRYRIYRDTTAIDSAAGPAGRTPLDSVGAATTTFTDTSAQVGRTYHYRLTAVDTAANESGFSNEAQATPTQVTPPEIAVGPRSVSDTLALDDSTRRTIRVRNVASGSPVSDLSFEVRVGPQRSEPVEWVVATPSEGRVAPGDTQAVTLRTRAVSTPPGTYNATIRITSNDPDQVSTDVSASLTVERPPVSFSNPDNLPSPGTGTAVRLDLPPAVTPQSATFFYGPAGQRTFQDTTRDLTGVAEGGTVSFSVPGGAVTRAGVRYYATVRGRLPGGEEALTLTVPATAPAQTAFLPVQSAGRVRAQGAFQGDTYRMLTVPFELGNRSVYDVLTNEYGAPDPATWRVARWNPDASSYAFGESAATGIAPGEALWLITAAGDSLTLGGGGRSVDASGPRSISLASGWNQIGSPFLFPVAWSDVRRPASVRPPVVYDASQPAGDRYRFAADTLRPWRGAFVFNEADTTVAIEVPPLDVAGGGTAPGASLATAASSTDEYRLQATAVHHRDGRTLTDRATWVGFAEAAAAGFGPRDRAKPPAVGPHVRLHVTPEEGPALARSLKPPTAEGAVWDLRVGLRLGEPLRTPKEVSIVLDEQGPRPPGFQRYVVDRDRETRLPVTHGSVSVRLTSDQPTRRLRLIVGTEAFARDHASGASLAVEETKLRANAPNPFAGSTTIPYQLAEETDVTIAIYDLLGRRVRTLVDATRQAGLHRVEWRPGDGANPLASGVYFCRMTAGSYRATRKMTLVR